VIDEGTNVQTGDLLLEFDASDLIDKRNEQEIVVANAEANLVIAQEKTGDHRRRSAKLRCGTARWT
jgi:multidrug efflux pump subunit AcrA (membrane-fusion protein)